MKQCVIDASVAAKWLVEESQKKEAGVLLAELCQNQREVIVPEFFYSEIANICWKWVRRKMMEVKDAIKALDFVLSLPLKRYPDQELADVALENALRLNVSVYDGIYIAVAEIYVAPLITADEALLRACRGRFDFIEPLNK